MVKVCGDLSCTELTALLVMTILRILKKKMTPGSPYFQVMPTCPYTYCSWWYNREAVFAASLLLPLIILQLVERTRPPIQSCTYTLYIVNKNANRYEYVCPWHGIPIGLIYSKTDYTYQLMQSQSITLTHISKTFFLYKVYHFQLFLTLFFL